MSGMTSKELVQTHYTHLGDGSWQCKICSKVRQQTVGKGYTNLLDHLHRSHSIVSDKQTRNSSSSSSSGAAAAVRPKGPKKSQKAVASSPSVVKSEVEPNNLYEWIEWIIMDNLEFSFVESEVTRRHTHLSKTSTAALGTAMQQLADDVRLKIATALRHEKQLGLLLDTWTDHGHDYVALHAVAPPVTTTTNNAISNMISNNSVGGTRSTRRTYTLALALMDDDNGDSESARAAVVIDLIDAALDEFNIDPSHLAFLVGDSAGVDAAVAKALKLPLVRCAAHRLRLAAELHVDSQRALINKVAKLTRRLYATSRRAMVWDADFAVLPPLPDATCWRATFEMLTRVLAFETVLNPTDPDFTSFLPTTAEWQRLATLVRELADFDSVHQKLQTQTQTAGLSLRDARRMLDKLVATYPRSCRRVLAPDAASVATPHFEDGIVRVLNGHESTLTAHETLALRSLAIARDGDSDTRHAAALSFADAALLDADTTRGASAYSDLAWVPPTCTAVEQAFATAGQRWSAERRALDPETLALRLFLRCNRSLWDPRALVASTRKGPVSKKRSAQLALEE